MVETGDLVAGRGAAVPARRGDRPGQGAGPPRLRRRRRSRPGRGRRGVRARGSAPDPPDRQGHRRRPDRLRRPAEPGAIEPPGSGDAEGGRDPHGGGSATARGAGGRDPLAAPFDVRAAVDQIGEEVLAAGTVRDALRELMQRGLDGRGGLDKLRRATPQDARGRPPPR